MIVYSSQTFVELRKVHLDPCEHFLTSLYVPPNLAGLCIECGHQRYSHKHERHRPR